MSGLAMERLRIYGHWTGIFLVTVTAAVLCFGIGIAGTVHKNTKRIDRLERISSPYSR